MGLSLEAFEFQLSTTTSRVSCDSASSSVILVSFASKHSSIVTEVLQRSGSEELDSASLETLGKEFEAALLRHCQEIDTVACIYENKWLPGYQ